ncbi:MAG: phospho-sugar mutase [Bacillota bacterium]
MNHMARYREWFLSDYFDDETKAELKDIEDDEAEIEDRFYKDLEFGTGGLRGKRGAGTNRINKYTVRKTTQGLANYIINYFEEGQERGVVIAYDSRHQSPEFAREAALVLAGNGIKAYVFDNLRPTPELSFAVRELKAVGGIVITASHNPPEYNGYKVYGPDGGQVVPDKARKITSEIQEIDDFSLVKMLEEGVAREQGLLKTVGDRLDRRYLEEMVAALPETELARRQGEELTIVYTPLHGTGYQPVKELFEELGFVDLHIVPEQAEPDPDFSTVDSPNPEEFSAFDLALDLAGDKEADLIIATDPDGDRMGVVVKNEDNIYTGLDGNQIGVLMTDFLLNHMELPKNGVIIKTIVSTEMVRRIAEDHSVEVMDVLTGFKYIGEKMEEFEETGDRQFVFGFEESYGYLVGNYARDKDAIVASGLVAIMALYYRQQGYSLYEKLDQLRKDYGYYLEELESIYLEGKKGAEIREETLSYLREQGPGRIADKQITAFGDYKKGIYYYYDGDEEQEIDLPESNVLQYKLEDETIITIRPSGTEPKLKIYFAVNAPTEEEAEGKMEHLKDKFLRRVRDIIEDIE